MKKLILMIALNTFVFSGFFNEDAAKNKAEYIENERLCKIFTQKVEKYKDTLRDDVLAAASLASYEYRAKLFCKTAEENKKGF
ncbi:MAG: hypothetical protein DRQ78_03530 [Epsilonproteobacteria bacterium]|nr:MAG: hypothetical protein DRQ78_03530 [Campylobacterota bacterium]